MKKVLFMAVFASVFAFTNAQTGVIGGNQNNDATKEKSNAGISFGSLSHNFGNIIEGQIATYEFQFKNNGTEPLKLTQVKASCGCTTPKYPTTEIMPGESANIRAEYNSAGRPGTFNKNIFVTSNAGDVTLTILGNVVKEPEKPISPIIIR
jgi:hypothetical protein